MILHPGHSRTRLSFPTIAGDHLAATLARRLDDAYHYVRRANTGGADPIDAVVVGPGGTWAITRCEERGRFRKRNGHWYRWNASTDSWVPWVAGPILAARLAGHRLELMLDRAGLPAVVEPCLVTSHGTEVTWEADQHAGIHVHGDLEILARDISRSEVLSAAQVDRIVALLDPRQPLPHLAPSTPRG